MVWRRQDGQEDVVRVGCSNERPGCWRRHPRNISVPNQVTHREDECGISQVSDGRGMCLCVISKNVAGIKEGWSEMSKEAKGWRLSQVNHKGA